MIKNAHIHFNHLGTPVADQFDDVYFSNDDGLAESHYVFYQQNHIPQRLQNHDRNHFAIAETGFGTGLKEGTLISPVVCAPSIPPVKVETC